VPRAPLPETSVTRFKVVSPPTSKGATPSSSLLRAHAPDHNPPPRFRITLIPSGLCRLLPAPAGRWPFPTFLCKSVPRCLGHDPGGSLGAYACFFPNVVGLPQALPMGRLPASIRGETSPRVMFRDRHHSSRSGLLVCSPPRSPLPLRPRPQGSRDFSIRAEPVSLPSQASDMLAVRTRQLTAEDFHLFRLAALSAAPRATFTGRLSGLLKRLQRTQHFCISCWAFWRLAIVISLNTEERLNGSKTL
jgi:hypothetical protein